MRGQWHWNRRRPRSIGSRNGSSATVVCNVSTTRSATVTARELFTDAGQPWLNSFHRYADVYGRASSPDDAGLETVDCRTLSSIVTLPSNATVIVKIDVQGHEVPVVEGSRDWFRDVDAVLCEVSFCEEYDGLAPSFVRVAAALACQDLYPIGFQSYGQTASNYAFERDVLFVKKSRLDRILFDQSLTGG